MTHELVEGVEVPTRTIGAFESFRYLSDGRYGCVGHPFGPALIKGRGFMIIRHVRSVPKCGQNIPPRTVPTAVAGDGTHTHFDSGMWLGSFDTEGAPDVSPWVTRPR